MAAKERVQNGIRLETRAVENERVSTAEDEDCGNLGSHDAIQELLQKTRKANVGVTEKLHPFFCRKRSSS